MSKVDSLIEHDYDGEDPVELSASKTVKEEVLPGRTIFEVWQDLGTQSRIVLICTVLICVTLAGFGTANIAVGAMTEYELTYNTTNFSASVLAAQFNYSAYGTDWCKNTTIIPELNTTLLDAYNKGGADTVAKKALAYGAVLLVSTGFLGLFGFDGVVQENRYELIMFLIIAYACLLRVSWQFFSYLIVERPQTLPPHQVLMDPKMFPLNWGAAGVAGVNLLFVIYTTYQTVRLFRSGDFNWIRYRLVGLTDKRLHAYYDNYQFFISVLKLDVQFNFSLVVLSGAFLFDIRASYAFWINIAVVGFTILWSIFVTVAVRRERMLLVWIALAFTVAEPAYIIYKLVSLLSPQTCSQVTIAVSSPTSLFIASGVLAVACRVVLVVLIIRCARNFGPGGLKDRVWDREETLTQIKQQRTASVNDYATYKV